MDVNDPPSRRPQHRPISITTHFDAAFLFEYLEKLSILDLLEEEEKVGEEGRSYGMS
jgi:hypothetical protein